MSIIKEEDILKVLISYNPWWRNFEVPKEEVKEMKRKAFFEAQEAFLNNEIRRFVLLTGARRVGKTTIVFQQIKELIDKGKDPKHILYVSFDNPILKFCTLDKLIELYEINFTGDGEKYLFLDEIQYAEDWNKWLKVIYDKNTNIHIMATGSASPIINKGLAESGAGRWITITVPTLSFYEYCQLKSINEKKITVKDFNNMTVEEVNKLLVKDLAKKTEIEAIDNNIPSDLKIEDLENLDEKKLGDIINSLLGLQKHFNRYLRIGGFPELVLATDDAYAGKILREDIVDKVLKRDMPSLFGIRNISILEKVFLYLCFESSNIINYNKMSQELDNTSIATIQDYIMYLKNANLIYESKPIGGKVLKSKPKVYIADSAIRNAVLMKDDIITDPTEMGYIVETAVYRHVYTYMQKFNGTVGYYRDSKTEKEIDIVAESVKTNLYIEIKYREKTVIKKDNPLYNIPKQNDKIYIITKEPMDYGITKLENNKKVVRIPAFAFLYLLGKQE